MDTLLPYTTVFRTIAVDRRYVGADGVKVDFHNCIAFGKTAEIIEKYMKKGTKVLTTGSVQNNNYTNKDGVKVYATQIKVDEIEFCESKYTGNNDVLIINHF